MGYVSAEVHVASTFGVLQMEFLVLSTVAVVSSFLRQYRKGKETLMGFHTACEVYKLLTLNILLPYIAFILP